MFGKNQNLVTKPSFPSLLSVGYEFSFYYILKIIKKGNIGAHCII